MGVLSPVSRRYEGSEAEDGDRCSDPKAKTDEQSRRDPIKERFEPGKACKRHDTHL